MESWHIGPTSYFVCWYVLGFNNIIHVLLARNQDDTILQNDKSWERQCFIEFSCQRYLFNFPQLGSYYCILKRSHNRNVSFKGLIISCFSRNTIIILHEKITASTHSVGLEPMIYHGMLNDWLNSERQPVQPSTLSWNREVNCYSSVIPHFLLHKNVKFD